MVHVLPGHIQMDDRQFDSTYDPAGPSRPLPSLSSVSCDATEEYHPIRRLYQLRVGDIKLEAFAQEKAIEHELVVFFKALIPGELAVILRLGWISHEILKGTGIFTYD